MLRVDLNISLHITRINRSSSQQIKRISIKGKLVGAVLISLKRPIVMRVDSNPLPYNYVPKFVGT